MHRLLDDMLGKEVEVRVSGIIYRGLLHDVSEDLMFIRGRLTFHQIPMDRVADVRLVQKRSGERSIYGKTS